MNLNDEVLATLVILLLWTLSTLIPPAAVSWAMRNHDDVYHPFDDEVLKVPEPEGRWRILYGISWMLGGIALLVLHSVIEDKNSQMIAFCWGTAMLIAGFGWCAVLSLLPRKDPPHDH